MFEYQAIVVSVHDGDTITLDVDLGFGNWMHDVKLRLYGPSPTANMGLNAPELPTAEGKAARDFLASLLPVGSRVQLFTVKDRKEKYGRYLAVIYDQDGRNINNRMIDSGHAKLAKY
jgi:micrococcal nuclease